MLFIILQHSLPQHRHHFRKMFVRERSVCQILHDLPGWTPSLIVRGFPHFRFNICVIHYDIGAGNFKVLSKRVIIIVNVQDVLVFVNVIRARSKRKNCKKGYNTSVAYTLSANSRTFHKLNRLSISFRWLFTVS